MTDNRDWDPRSFVQLIRDLPSLLINLAKAELAQLRVEMTSKAKHAGVGIGLFAGAALMLFFAFAVLVAAAILGLALVLPPWLAALIVFVALLLIALILVLIGRSALKKALPLVPQKTLDSLTADAAAIKGTGPHDN